MSKCRECKGLLYQQCLKQNRCKRWDIEIVPDQSPPQRRLDPYTVGDLVVDLFILLFGGIVVTYAVAELFGGPLF